MHAALCLCLIAFAPGSAIAADPGLPGPYAVATSAYDFGDSVYQPIFTQFPGPVELRASLTFPASLEQGPYPVVMLLHGRHATCFDPAEFDKTSTDWPCPGGQLPIPNYWGYAYLAEHLASHGFVVVSISTNGIVSRDLESSDLGLIARAELILVHLALMSIYNSSGGYPFDNLLVGKLDLNRVALMGHSLGGDGVVTGHLLNSLLGSPFGIKALMLLAPTDALGISLNNVALATILPYCDAGIYPFGTLPGARYFDNSLYSEPGDTGGKHLLVTAGANHSYFNMAWTEELFPPGSADNWILAENLYGTGPDSECNKSVAGNGRLSATQQRASLLPYAAAFFREYLGGPGGAAPVPEDESFALLTGDAPPPPSALTDRIYVSYHAPDDPSQRRDVNRISDPPALDINSLGDLALAIGLAEYSYCGYFFSGIQPCSSVLFQFQPHAYIGQLKLAWDVPFSSYNNLLPDGARDVSGFEVFQFRAAVNFEDPRNPAGQSQDFVVRLTDGAGRSAITRVSEWSQGLHYPRGSMSPVTPRLLLNGVRIPLSAFAGVDLSDIRYVSFEFGYLVGHEQGSILVSGLAFSR